MFYADNVGLRRILDRVATFHRELGERWEPAPLLERLCGRGLDVPRFRCEARPVRPVRIAPPATVVRRGGRRRHLHDVAASARSLSGEADGVSGVMGVGGAGADISCSARRRGRLAPHDLCARRSQRVRKIAQAILDRGALVRASDRHSVGQQHRARAAGAGRDVQRVCSTRRSRPPIRCRRGTSARCAISSARMEPGLVFAAEGAAFERALTDVHAAGCRAGRLGVARRRRSRSRRSRALEAHAGDPRRGRCACESRWRHHCQDAVHVGLDRPAEGRHQHAAHALFEPADDSVDVPVSADAPPVLCDWLPWNHTAGGNHNFGIVLYNGGTLYIDEGKPTPAHFGATVRNLRETCRAPRISPCLASTRC